MEIFQYFAHQDNTYNTVKMQKSKKKIYSKLEDEQSCKNGQN